MPADYLRTTINLIRREHPISRCFLRCFLYDRMSFLSTDALYLTVDPDDDVYRNRTGYTQRWGELGCNSPSRSPVKFVGGKPHDGLPLFQDVAPEPTRPDLFPHLWKSRQNGQP